MAIVRSCAEIGCKMMELMGAGALSSPQVELLEKSRVSRTYRRGEEIFSQGDSSGGIYCLRAGHAFLWHVDAFGYKTAFRVVGLREVFGFRSCFAEDGHAATAQALTTCHVCHYPQATIRSLIEANGKFALQFLRTVARDQGPAHGLLLRAQHLPVRVRLGHLLWILKDGYGHAGADQGLVLEIPLMRQDIASMLAVRPESVTRAISELKREGIATFSGRKVTVPDSNRLYELLRRSYE